MKETAGKLKTTNLQLTMRLAERDKELATTKLMIRGKEDEAPGPKAESQASAMDATDFQVGASSSKIISLS